MPFEIRTVTVKKIVYVHVDQNRDDDLLAVTVKDIGVIYIRGTFSDWPSSTPWVVDEKLPIPEPLRTWYKEEVARIRDAYDEDTRQYVDSLPYNPFRFQCNRVETVGEPFMFCVDGRSEQPRYGITYEDVISITPITRKDAEDAIPPS